MGSVLLVATRVAPLFAVSALGVLAGRLRLFGAEEHTLGAIGILNRYALYVAFPSLIFSELTNPALVMPRGGGFVATHVAALVVLCVVVAAAARLLPPSARGPVLLASAYGNIAYLGIPFCTAVLGPASTGVAALSASVHSGLGLALGPWLLVGSTSPAARRTAILRVAGLPLVWMPLIALAGRALPEAVVASLRGVVAPVGVSAAPVALFMLGLYLYAERSRALRWDGTFAVFGVAKLVAFPAITFGVARLFALADPTTLRVLVLQAAMPTAITTFALASELGVGREATARSIVMTSVAACVTLPVIAALLDRVAP